MALYETVAEHRARTLVEVARATVEGKTVTMHKGEGGYYEVQVEGVMSTGTWGEEASVHMWKRATHVGTWYQEV